MFWRCMRTPGPCPFVGRSQALKHQSRTRHLSALQDVEGSLSPPTLFPPERNCHPEEPGASGDSIPGTRTGKRVPLQGQVLSDPSSATLPSSTSLSMAPSRGWKGLLLGACILGTYWGQGDVCKRMTLLSIGQWSHMTDVTAPLAGADAQLGLRGLG